MVTGPKYLIRFDDICPTMNWQVWEEIEQSLLEYGIRPIIAVVPDNRDPNLVVEEACLDFWARVRHWQDLGWTIALHGYQHVFVNANPGLLSITRKSEFAGLDRVDQETKLRAGLEIFHSNGIVTDTWVAPSHSFDATTLEVLQRLGIHTISDGFTTRHFVDRRGLVWVPCQQWDRFRVEQAGLFTVCIHHNRWKRDAMVAFRNDIETHLDCIVSIPWLLASVPATPLRPVEELHAWVRVFWRFRLRRVVKRIIRWRRR